MEGSSSCRRRGRGRLIWHSWQRWTIKKESDFAKPKPRPIPRDAVISFVEELEKADQYFEFKRYLAGLDGIDSKCYIPDSLRDDIVYKLKDARFKKLDQEDIDHAVDCLNGVLQFNRFSGLQYVRDEGPTDWDSEQVITTCSLVLSKTVDKATGDGVYPLFGLVEVLDNFTRSNPIFTLVLQTRNKTQGRCLDPNPEVELLELKKTYPFYYHGVIAEEHTFKAKTVTFTYEAQGTSVEHIKSLLSKHWKIFSVCVNRLDTHSEMAHVTFEDLTEANEALCLVAQGQVKIPGQTQPVGVVRTRYNKPPSSCKFPHVKPEHVKAAKTGVQKVENALFADALNKYRKLIEKNNWGRSASTLPGQSESGQKGTELPDGVSVSDVSPGHSLQSVT